MFRATKITLGIDFPRVTLINSAIVRPEGLFICRRCSGAQRAHCCTKGPFSEPAKPPSRASRAAPRRAALCLSPVSYIFFALIASRSLGSTYIQVALQLPRRSDVIRIISTCTPCAASPPTCQTHASRAGERARARARVYQFRNDLIVAGSGKLISIAISSVWRASFRICLSNDRVY